MHCRAPRSCPPAPPSNNNNKNTTALPPPPRQLEAWQHIKLLAWLDRLTGQPGWKVWSSQLLRFEECARPATAAAEAAGEAELRVVWQEELADQFVFLGMLPLGLYTIRADPHTPLCWLLAALRNTAGCVVAACMPVVMRLLAAVGVC